MESYESLINQKANGLILLSKGFEAFVVPEDAEIKMETPEFDALEKCSNCKFEHFASDEDPCCTCIPKRDNETGIRHMTNFQKKEE